MSPPVETACQLAIELVQNNGLPFDANRTFDYLSNPVFTDIRPRKHLIVWVLSGICSSWVSITYLFRSFTVQISSIDLILFFISFSYQKATRVV